MHVPTRMERLRYSFDNFMARGTIALIAGLFVASAVGIFLISFVINVLGLAAPDSSLPDLLWASLMRTLDSGTMGGDTGSPGFLVGMLTVTLGGIFVISALIGIISTGLEGKLDQMRKGRSRVLETGHTVILGWSQQVFTVLSELIIANANVPKSTIVILADRDKVEMEDEIRSRFETTGKTNIVCRSGSPIDIDDLEIARLETSRSIIILSPEIDEPDADVIKTMLAITNHPRRRAEPYHIVAELREPANMDVARLVGRDEAQLILAGDLISRIVAQTCRQSGLSIVYTELLDFDGDEIYFASLPALAGQTFGDALFAFEESTLIGLRPAGGAPTLNPPMKTVIGPGDHVIVISADDDTVRLSSPTASVDDSAIATITPAVPRPERTLILGWNWRGTDRHPRARWLRRSGLAPQRRRGSGGGRHGPRRVTANIDQPGRHLQPRRHDQQGRPRFARRPELRPRDRSLLLGCPRSPAGRLEDAHHAPPPARHFRPVGQGLLNRVGDAGPPEPGPRRGDSG
jgi:voltage-gated potassium channel Kch